MAIVLVPGAAAAEPRLLARVWKSAMALCTWPSADSLVWPDVRAELSCLMPAVAGASACVTLAATEADSWPLAVVLALVVLLVASLVVVVPVAALYVTAEL